LRCLLFFTGFLLFFSSCAQEDANAHPHVDTISHRLGETEIFITMSNYGAEPKNLFLLQLHHNEETAGQAADRFLRENGGSFLSIHNRGNRLIEFTLEGKKFRFDPNRMFTPLGIRNSLEKLSGFSPEAAKEIERFADKLLSLLPDSALVIAVHNNTDEAYSVMDYGAGRALRKDAARVHFSRTMDPDDFVFTTDAGFFDRCVSEGISVVLQDNEAVTNDGSLSVLFGKKKRPYVNIEAQHGHLEEQLKMLKAILREEGLKNDNR
jgi:hypothetical protein